MDVRPVKAGRDLVTLPKVHVHAHLDGSFPLAAVRAVAARSGQELTPPASFRDEWDFFDAYGRVPAVVRTPADLAELCQALVRQEHRQGVRFFEPAIEPQLYAPRFGSILDVTALIVGALQAAAADLAGTSAGELAEAGPPMVVGANLTINTDQDLAIADELAEAAAAFADRGVTSLGTAGFIEPAGLARFRPAIDRARAAGLPLVAHAGETTGAASVWEAVEEGAERISHGIGAVEDQRLLDRLASERIVCDVCPTSNVALRLTATLADHPARRMIETGVPITLNADDQLWFSSSVTGEYQVARETWHLSDSELADLARNGLLVNGFTGPARDRYQADLQAWLTLSDTHHRSGKPR